MTLIDASGPRKDYRLDVFRAQIAKEENPKGFKIPFLTAAIKWRDKFRLVYLDEERTI